MTTAEFIREYRERDIRQLALQANRFPDVDMPYALDQIQGWQIARRKLPKWAACDGVIFPPHLSMEQCSSEPTAQYKLNLATEWTTLNSELSTQNCRRQQFKTQNSKLTTHSGAAPPAASRSGSGGRCVAVASRICCLSPRSRRERLSRLAAAPS